MSAETISKLSNSFRNVVKSSWQAINSELHKGLDVKVIANEVTEFSQEYEGRLHNHVNILVIHMFDQHGIVRRLKRIKHFELV